MEVGVSAFADVSALQQWPGYETAGYLYISHVAPVFYVCVVKARQTAGLKTFDARVRPV